ncbi:SGNH/GDSL hydrolase family protein [Halomontanus rarus]|uniref:SGNH/GDSL hydrolase family protein n=1 Tax=Halomontanus rarus TaxID=3034020 RepID=UPI0023E8815C|nr:SGNH/GDSL hydrolase family protein [Halovivax sp. TS33]
MIYDDIAFHNVAELRETSDGGRLLQRVPEHVREHLNDDARKRMRVPATGELRFVTDEETVRLVLSSPDGPATAVPFWGPFQAGEPVTIGTDPEPVELSYPDTLAEIGPETFADRHISPRVWRLRLGYDVPPVRYHGVEGEVRPPRTDELPDRRLLTYGTSITDGASATRDHLTYPAQAARRLGADVYNLGSAGSAYCEPEIADFIASQEWDVATLAISVNMLGDGFSLETFRERATYMLETVADAHPDDPVVAITLFPLFADFEASLIGDDWRATPAEYREALREVVAAVGRDNLHLLEGPELLPDVGGHTADVIHPGDNGMIQMGENLAAALEPLLE